MSPILTIVGCDRPGCQDKSNGDEATWWAVREDQKQLHIARYLDTVTPKLWRFFCGQACLLAEVANWMTKQQAEKEAGE